jgi:hypothetical protein
MLRTGISLLAIAGLLASQLASVPHAHAGMTSAGRQRHDALPHFHLRWSGHHAAGQNHAGHPHGAHRHGHDHRPARAGDSQPAPGPAGAEHDDWAVYCPAGAITAVPGEPPAMPRSLQGGPEVGPGETVAALESNEGGGVRGRPPDGGRAGAHLYLTLRNLRI